LSRYGIRASAALNSEVCDHHPEIIDEGSKLGWEWIGHNQTNALRLTEMDPAGERAAIRATIDSIEAASGTRPVGWLGAGLAETWNTLDYLAEADIHYFCDWVNDDQPYLFEIGTPPLVSLPYSVQTNDVPAYFEMKVSVPELMSLTISSSRPDSRPSRSRARVVISPAMLVAGGSSVRPLKKV